MATLRQKKLAKTLVKNLQADKPLNAGEVVKSVGYGTGIQRQPARAIESEGVQEELIRIGFSPDKAKEVVSEILIGGENDSVKLKAADMVFKVHGTYAAEKHIVASVDLKPSERLQELANRLRNANG